MTPSSRRPAAPSEAAPKTVPHTPGPWTTTNSDKDPHSPADRYQGGLRGYGIKRPSEHGRDHDASIAFVYVGIKEEDEAIANARLIAAAPELLSALRVFVQMADSDAHFDVPALLDMAVTSARAAIRKALGSE